MIEALSRDSLKMFSAGRRLGGGGKGKKKQKIETKIF